MFDKEARWALDTDFWRERVTTVAVAPARACLDEICSVCEARGLEWTPGHDGRLQAICLRCGCAAG